MNKALLIGRLTRNPEITQTGNVVVAKYNLAVERKIKNGDQKADFINCVTFGKNAEFVEKYLKKGTKIAVEGRIQTGSYTNKDGKTVYTTDVVVESHEFCESKGAQGTTIEPKKDVDGFMNVSDAPDTELPF